MIHCSFNGHTDLKLKCHALSFSTKHVEMVRKSKISRAMLTETSRLLLLKPSASLSSSFRMNYVTPRKTFDKSRQNVKSCCFFFCSGPPLLSTLPKSHNSLSIKRWIAAFVSQKPSCSRDTSPFGKEIRGGHRSDPQVEFTTFYLRLHPSLFRKLTNLLDFFRHI